MSKYDILILSEDRQVVPSVQEVIAMTVLEVLSLLNLLCVIIFGVINTLKKK